MYFVQVSQQFLKCQTKNRSPQSVTPSFPGSTRDNPVWGLLFPPPSVPWFAFLLQSLDSFLRRLASLLKALIRSFALLFRFHPPFLRFLNQFLSSLFIKVLPPL